jgi:hypothetical protein
MCKCLKEIREAIIENNKANYVDIDCSTITDFSKKDGIYKTGQRLAINYDHVLKNGEVRKKNRKSFITHNFCPFCGEKY